MFSSTIASVMAISVTHNGVSVIIVNGSGNPITEENLRKIPTLKIDTTAVLPNVLARG